MLNKEVCLHCFIKQSAINPPDAVDNVEALLNPTPVEVRFNVAWNKFECLCYINKYLYVDPLQDPPEKCPYVLEHTLTQPSWIKKIWLRYKSTWQYSPILISLLTMAFIINVTNVILQTINIILLFWR